MKNSAYDWLAEASCVVVDEAHAATSPAYTRLLKWQGLGGSDERVPLIGLTATPFRGTSESGTKALINRFGKRRLDAPAFEDVDVQKASAAGMESAAGAQRFMHYLQEQGVIAKVEHALLDGVEMELTDEELRTHKDMKWLPQKAEARVGADVTRNRTIVDSIVAQDVGWTTLVFAASVEHAQVLSALLAREGISAASISSNTGASLRRHYVEQFRKGELKVLTNYGVFTQGFDAPAVRAVYVTRPTYSPNVYQQMIGRGLRGPLNGGKEICKIVNVADNISNFGRDLVFTDFEYLWDGSDG